MESKFYVPSISDDTVVNAFFESFEKFEQIGRFQSLRLAFEVPWNYGEISFQTAKGCSESESAKLLKDSGARSISMARLSTSTLTISYSRFPSSLSNGSYGELKFSHTGQTGVNPSDLSAVLKQLTKQLFIGQVDHVMAQDSKLISSHSEVLSKLESLGVEMQKDTKKLRDHLEEEFHEKRKSLDAEFLKKSSALEESYRDRQEALEKLRNELDDKSNTHARREIRKDLGLAIRERADNFKLSSNTSKLRTPIHFAFGVLIVLSAVGVVEYSKEYLRLLEAGKFLDNSIAVVVGLLKPIGLTALFSSSFVFYIKWLNAWFHNNAEEERALRKYQLDIERSSWIVETVLESVSQHKHQIPDELIMRFSNNLFSMREENNRYLKHPVNDLASALLGNSANVKLKVGENEVFLDRKSLKNLQSSEE
ncbi:hypothetical protein [Bdellovibrio bacteriovorus]|uniref:hypothetical protein n=1 Tax=Bdellovibrio bacteriovorus TaxID=959 RepID=UPI003AA7F3C9